MNISEINDLFDNGYIPNHLFYSIEPMIIIDPRKITYTPYYQSYEFYEKKFNSKFYNITGFDSLINAMSELAIKNDNTPLKEINKKISISN